MHAGRYIAFEGPEASGKSTHAARLADALGAVLTRETGGTEIGRRIREILHDTSATEMSHRAEALLTAADRAQHIEQVVMPALMAGRHVVTDRSVYSALAYQGYGRELPIEDIRRINEWAVNSCWPDLVLWIDVAPSVIARRMSQRSLDRFEQEDEAFHRRVRAGFAAMAAADPQHWVQIDAGAPVDEVAATIRAAVHDRLGL